VCLCHCAQLWYTIHPHPFIVINDLTQRKTIRAYFSVYYYTKCVLLKAHCATLKMKMCNINFMLGIKTGAAECLLNSPNAKFLYFQGLLLIP